MVELDMMKGVGILAMIVGHRLSDITSLCEFIHTFHMPLFVVISGYLFKVRSLKQFFYQSLRRLLIPFVIVFLIFLFFGKDEDYISSLLVSQPPLWVIWFLPALFVCQFLASFAIPHPWLSFLFCLIGILSIFLYGTIKLPFYILHGFFMFPFFILGHILAQKQVLSRFNYLERSKKNIYIILALSIWLFSYLVAPKMLRFAICQAPWFLLGDVVTSLSALFVIFILCKRIAAVKRIRRVVLSMAFLGKISLIILCLHSISHLFLSGFPWIGAYWNYTSFLGDLAWPLGYMIIEIPIVIVLAIIVERIKAFRYVFGMA